MLIEMRRVALLILVGTLFRVDFTPDMDAAVAVDHEDAQTHLAGVVDVLDERADWQCRACLARC